MAKERQDISYDAYIKDCQDAEDKGEEEMYHTGYMKVGEEQGEEDCQRCLVNIFLLFWMNLISSFYPR